MQCFVFYVVCCYTVQHCKFNNVFYVMFYAKSDKFKIYFGLLYQFVLITPYFWEKATI